MSYFDRFANELIMRYGQNLGNGEYRLNYDGGYYIFKDNDLSEDASAFDEITFSPTGKFETTVQYGEFGYEEMFKEQFWLIKVALDSQRF